MGQDTMTHETDIQSGIDRTELPVSDLDNRLHGPQSGNGASLNSITHAPIPELSYQTEADILNAEFESHKRMIGLLMRDHGHTQHEVLQFEHEFTSFNNAKEKKKHAVLEELERRRMELAIQNYPLYVKYLSDISPDHPERFTKLQDEYSREESTERRKAQISEEIRTELERVVHWKAMFYTEMLSTAMMDAGEPQEKAEEEALMKSEILTTRANSIIEKVSLFEALKNDSLTYLISHLQDSIMVWNELFPGEGEVEESKILGERRETRMKNAKDLYKRTKGELEKRYADYTARAEGHFKAEGNNNGHDVSAGLAHRKAAESLAYVLDKPRLEQIRIMSSGKFIQKAA